MASISVEDRLEIHELLARYCRGLDTQRRQEFLDTFWDDGILDSSLAGGEFVGHAGIGAWFDRVHSEADFAAFLGGQHRPGNTILEVLTSDQVTAWSQFALLTQGDQAPGIAALGEYDDVVTRRGDMWRLSRRVIRIAMVATAPTATTA